MDNKIIENVHISQIVHGDTIEHNGELRTVTNKWIKFCSFLGTTLYGDSYRSGRILVKRVKFAVPTNKGVVIR